MKRTVFHLIISFLFPKYPLRKLMAPWLTVAFFLSFLPFPGSSQGFFERQSALTFIGTKSSPGAMVIAGKEHLASIVVDENDFPGVLRVARLVQNDLSMVTGRDPVLVTNGIPTAKTVIIAGTIGKSSLIDQLVSTGKLNVDDVSGKWENTLVELVDNPFPGVGQALVIAGSDKRGTIYGLFELSEQAGVSPWYWWADVPVTTSERLFARKGRYNFGEPRVKYRGIFINDEAPALAGWAHEKFGGFNHRFYNHVFELILRLKGNLLWPAMWGRAIYDDDPLSAPLADEYGIVISTSHHEPMMRAHVEWDRYGKGHWNYATNAEVLRDFWRTGIERMGNHESIVTLAMRGDGDEPMSDDRNIELLTRIVTDQRKIIEEVTGQPAENTPQVWALYKEVQDYYDMGMRVPDDVTLLYCDDNWGNIRRVPGEKEKLRKGGSGMYYHFDYVGGPRNYKWLNTNPLPRIWEQMQLCWDHQIDRLWIVNVGDIKPMELPTSFFLDLAWDPTVMTIADMENYTREWAKQQFGTEHSDKIAQLLTGYTRIFGMRKPELVDPNTYSLTHYRDFERITREFNALASLSGDVSRQLDHRYADAYYQLVQYPVEAGSNLYNLYYATARNRMYARQGRSLTNTMADSVSHYFERDAAMNRHFHTQVADGKWNHMMSQTRIGYTYWQQPDKDVIPKTERITLPSGPEPDVYVEGSDGTGPAVLPEMDNLARQEYYVEVFNKGSQPFMVTTTPSHPWLKVSQLSGTIVTQKRIFVSADWKKVPPGVTNASLTHEAAGKSFTVEVPVRNYTAKELRQTGGFIESTGFISFEAEDYTGISEKGPAKWTRIAGLGYGSSGMAALPWHSPEENGESWLEYPVFFHTTGEIKVHVHLAPTLNFTGGDGFEYGITMGNGPMQRVNIHADESMQAWERSVAANVTIGTSIHTVTTPGMNWVRIHILDPGLVFQKVVIDAGGLQRSYLGPEHSTFRYLPGMDRQPLKKKRK